jgi:hypothetical protein
MQNLLRKTLGAGVAVWAALFVLDPELTAQRLASYDVVVMGATPAGIAAAIVAGRAHLSVALVGESPVPGGLLSSGVSRADDAMAPSASGIYNDFRQRVAKYYLTQLPNDPVVKADLATPRVRHNVAAGQAWEPKVAISIYRQMLAEVPDVHVFYNELPVAAKVDGKRVVAVVTKGLDGSQNVYRGRAIIDATYEGDVAAFAGVPFSVGREPRTPEEPHAGVIYTDAFCEGAYQLPGTILPGSTGAGDKKIMAYDYRFLVKDYGVADGPHRLKTPPPGYDPKRYKWTPTKPYLPNGKIDVLGINWGNDFNGPNYAYPTASWEERKKIEEKYRDYALGFLYYIQTDGKQPSLGLADDEFIDNGNFPYSLYVREARRIDGLYKLTESDLHKDLRGDGLRGPLQPNSIAIGLYEMDSHGVENPANRASRCSGEGAINLVDVTGPYGIPYGVMVPRNRDGLLVPVAISASHVAMSSVRMEPVWSALGEAAGTATVLSLQTQKQFSQVPVPEIQQQLLGQGQQLFFYQDLDAKNPHFAAVQEMSVKGAVDGDQNFRFHPDRPITLGELSRLLVVGLNVPISITASHFHDVPRGSEYFKYIETLYDASIASGHPFLPFEARKYLIYAMQADSHVYVSPDSTVSNQLFRQLVDGVLKYREDSGMGKASSWKSEGDPATKITRGDACEEIKSLITARDTN